MARFNARPLRVLDAIYNFVGGLGNLSQFGLEGQIQPVHDCSREAELASGLGRFGGFYTIVAKHAHTATGGITTTFNVYNPSGTHTFQNGLSADELANMWVWVGKVWGAMVAGTPSSFDYAWGGVGTPPGMQGLESETGLTTPAMPLIYLDGITSGGAGENHLTSTVAPEVLPVLVPKGGSLVLMSASNGGVTAITIEMSALVWIGPVGVMPPGHS